MSDHQRDKASEGLKFNETRLMVQILGAVEGDHEVSQRSIARDLGVALGLINAYFKRCVKKGLIKVSNAPTSRYAYYLTPKGFAEKSRLTADYLSHSLAFFRQARESCTSVLSELAEQRHWRRVAFAGSGDLAEIGLLCSYEQRIEVVAVIDGSAEGVAFLGVRLVADAAEVEGDVDGFVVTSVSDSQSVYDGLDERFGANRVAAPQLLGLLTSERKRMLAGG